MQKNETKEYECWIEITANKATILDSEKFSDAVRHCKDAGMTAMILSVKDTTGFVLYQSTLAPHYSEYDSDFNAKIDYVNQCFSIIRSFGMKCYASFDVFTEGNKKMQHPKMKGLYEEGFSCEVYGLDENGNAVIRKSTEAADLTTVGSIDDFGEIFVNPGNSRVCDYEISLLREFAEKYHPDGIVLDRVRYVGLSADFSELTRKQWEEYSSITDERWPEDIYTIEKTKDGWKEKPGKYFGSFVTCRMQVIHDFVEQVSVMLHHDFPAIRFMDYTGSWYPLYYQVGANWAHPLYEPSEFPWCDRVKLQQSAYAPLVDTLMSGCYYEYLTEQEAEEAHQPAYWYSVTGAGKLAERVTCQKADLVDSLFLDQYRGKLQKIPQAIHACMEQSEGCMLFDLSYLVSGSWWKYAHAVYETPLEKSQLHRISDICSRVFAEEYHVTEEKLSANLLEDAEFDAASSLCLWNRSDDTLIGFGGVKISNNQDLYPDTAWMSIFAIAPEWQNCGYGTLLLERMIQKLREAGIKKIYLGQDFANFFSGIPAPDDRKLAFFERLGFTLNIDEHYDLEANIVRNASLDTFDRSPWENDFSTDFFHGEKDALLSFLQKEFPGRWEYEAETAIEEHKDPREIVLLFDRSQTKIEGYCMLTVERDADGRKTGYGGLGPIGIAKDIRGNHVGDYFLHESLCQLAGLGVTRVNIDWTILKKYYGQFEFMPVRTYRAAYLLLQ